jgi:hypothetical protein
MRPQPVVAPEARADVLHAAAYYEAQRSGFGYQFLDEFERATALIREAPLLSTLVELSVRRVLMRHNHILVQERIRTMRDRTRDVHRCDARRVPCSDRQNPMRRSGLWTSSGNRTGRRLSVCGCR